MKAMLITERKMSDYFPELRENKETERDETNYNVVLLHFETETNREKTEKNLENADGIFPGTEAGFLCRRIDDRTLILLLTVWHQVPAEEQFSMQVEKFFSGKEETALRNWYAGIGSYVCGQCELDKSLKDACTALDALSWKGWNKAVCYSENLIIKNQKYPADPHDPFLRAFESHDWKRCFQILDEFKGFLLTGHFTIDQRILDTYYSLEEILLSDKNPEQNLQPEKAPEQAETIEELYQSLKRKIEALREHDDKKENCLTVRKVIEYMEENYSDSELCVRVLANHVYLTSTYLSYLFKKDTGETISRYLLKIRMRHALELMQNPSLKFYQVAKEVGYDDANYFAKIFKKQTGMTPSEYKEKRD